MLSGGKRRDKLAIEINGGLAQTKFASLAQLVEHSVDNRKVDGSGPSGSTITGFGRPTALDATKARFSCVSGCAIKLMVQ